MQAQKRDGWGLNRSVVPTARPSLPARPLLEVGGLRVVLRSAAARQHGLVAVDGVSFSLEAGRCLCLVGESGSGKSLLAYAVADLLPPAAHIESGHVIFQGVDRSSLGAMARRQQAGRDIGFVFQEPQTALNPVLTVGWQIAETARLAGRNAKDALTQAHAMLQTLQIRDPARILAAYPHQLSGGMKQRAVLAMALLLDPPLLIADEPTTALDVTVQADVLHFLRRRMQQTHGALLFITHDLDVAASLADDLAVMYAGRLVEWGPAPEVLNRPQHPYTQALLAARPRRARLADRSDRLTVLPGQVPLPGQGKWGCAFAARCRHATSACTLHRPELRAVAKPSTETCEVQAPFKGAEHAAACFLMSPGES